MISVYDNHPSVSPYLVQATHICLRHFVHIVMWLVLSVNLVPSVNCVVLIYFQPVINSDSTLLVLEGSFANPWSLDCFQMVIMANNEYWVGWLKNIALVLYCSPELHFCTRLLFLFVRSASKRPLQAQVPI